MAPPTVLVLMDYYLPGYKAGGPVRSVEALAAALGTEFRIRIACRDRDCGDDQAYDGVVPDVWHPCGVSSVTYLTPPGLGLRQVRRLMRATDHDVLYLNSLFSPRMTILPLLLRRLGLVPERPVVLAPRGELHPGALRAPRKWRMGPVGRLLARLRVPSGATKRAYISLGRALGMFRGVVWQASGSGERADIVHHFGRRASVLVASDLVLAPPRGARPERRPKIAGALRVAYVSRIHPKKNLEGAILGLHRVEGAVEFDIYGPVDDPVYWDRCRALLERLPGNVTWRYHGPIPHEQVAPVLTQHDVMLLLTWGENFGHIIVEALLAGCPPVISDCTPWVGLEREVAGWDLPPEDIGTLTRVLQRLVPMDEAEFRRWSEGAAALGGRIASDPATLERNRALFQSAVGRQQRGALPVRAEASRPASSGDPVTPLPGGLAATPNRDGAPR